MRPLGLRGRDLVPEGGGVGVGSRDGSRPYVATGADACSCPERGPVANIYRRTSREPQVTILACPVPDTLSVCGNPFTTKGTNRCLSND